MPLHNFIPKIVYGSTPVTITFDFPPLQDDDEQSEAIKRESISIAGRRQVSLDRTEITRKVLFSFVTPTLLASLQTFFDAWGKYGKPFFYYPHHLDTGVVFTYELLDLKFNPQRQLAKNGDFLYKLPLTFRRSL